MTGLNKMSYRNLLFFILLSFCLANVPLATAAELFEDDRAFIQIVDKGEINWTDGLVRASGMGPSDENVSNPAIKKLQAERSAKIIATRNLLDVLRKIRVDESTTTDEYLISSDFVRNSLHRIVREAKIVEKNHLSGGNVEVVLEMSIKGPFIQTMVPDTGNLALSSEGKQMYTGLIVDATGIGIKPALAPKILDERGREIYGPSYAKRGFFLAQGLAAYTRNLSYAMERDRIMENPLVIRGLRPSSEGDSDIIISREDAGKLKGASNNLNFLQECRVIIVID